MRLKTSYTAREVASLTGLTARQLQWWDETRVFQPAIAPRRTSQGGFTERRYSPVDLLELLALASLKKRGFSTGTLKQLMATLHGYFRRRLSETLDDAGELRLLTDGKGLFLRTRQGHIFDLLADPQQPLVTGDGLPLEPVTGRARPPKKKKKAMIRTLMTLWLALVMGAASPIAQQTAPTFRAGVDLVTVEFFALSKDGRPILDLRPDEITLKVNGRARAIRGLNLIRVPAPGPDTAGPPIVADVPPPFGENAAPLPPPERTVILAFEDDSFRPGRERLLRTAVDRLLAGFSPRDRVAVVTMPFGGTKQDFTTDHKKIQAAMLQVKGNAPQAQTGSEAACLTRRTLESLSGILNSLRGGAGPTTVVFFTAKMAPPRRDAAPMMAPGMCELTTEHFENVGRAAAGVRAHFFIVQPDEGEGGGAPYSETVAGVGSGGSEHPFAGIENLAGVTGGERLKLGRDEDPLVRVVRETSAYYLVGFDAEPAEYNGLTHSLDVTVSRANVVVRNRPGLRIAKSTVPPVKGLPVSARDMMRTATVFRDLPLRVTGYVSEEGAGSKTLKIVALADSPDPSVTFTEASMALFDGNGRLSAQWTAAPADLAKTTLVAALSAPPGPYRLRVAATDALGRSGTADYSLMAEIIPAGALRLGSIVLGVTRLGAGFAPRLQFGAEPVAVASVEIYNCVAGAKVTTLLEVATTENGPAFLAMPIAIDRVGSTETCIAKGAIPIGALPAGDFVVRVIVGIEGQPPGRVIRTLRKSIK